MNSKLILFLFSFLAASNALAIDVGDGSDGTCDVLGVANTQITAAKKYYQCTTLDLDDNLSVFKGGQAGAGGAAVVIKVQGLVRVFATKTIDLSGLNGEAGDGSIHNGGSAGAGGRAGGNSVVGADGLSGSGSGGGVFGKFVVDNPGGTSSYGGGGGGGSFKTKSATEPDNGSDGGGAVLTTRGSNGNNFVTSESQFDTSFEGGSGGAAGGGGTISGVAVSGSSGGGGGGALRIIAGGNIEVNGIIIAAGGNGGGNGATASSGGGGGASGGAIWLQSAGSLIVSASGSITTAAGTGGTNDLASGFGGDGGIGGIRLDDANGAIVNNGTITPAPYSTTFTPTAIASGNSALTRQYQSGVACARVSLETDNPYNYLMTMTLGMILAGIFYFVVSRKEKFVLKFKPIRLKL